ncbi:MAG: winged helix DNA-binding domain-containing protein [Chloroflexota bacterium]
MNSTDLVSARLISQHIAGTKFKTVKELVRWMGAMQAQDFAMVKWAVGVRLPNSTEQTVETAINNGEIIRTHLLRPTWHLVSADDIYWLLALSAPQLRSSVNSRHKELGLSETVISKSNSVLERSLRDGNHLTREELAAEFGKAKINTLDNRLSHLLMQAELDGVVCSGATKNGKPAYALLEERVPRTKSLTKDEALEKLAQKYFTSHCPATLQDFVWWSGLPVGDAKRALELVKPDLISETINSQTYWFDKSFSVPKFSKESVYLLPAFDEFTISYKDRSAALPFEDQKKTISDNGIFRPIVVINGQVTGVWKRTIKKDKVIVEVKLFKQPSKAIKSLIENAAAQIGKFLEKETEIVTTYETN